MRDMNELEEIVGRVLEEQEELEFGDVFWNTGSKFAYVTDKVLCELVGKPISTWKGSYTLTRLDDNDFFYYFECKKEDICNQRI
jgi:hypothetical protein